MTADKNGSPPCGIYVRIDEFSDMQKLITSFRQMTMVINRASGYEKNMNIVEFVYKPEYAQEITDLIMLAQNEGVVAIVSGNIPDFECYGADGILLENTGDVKAAREKLGADAIIGLDYSNIKDIDKLKDITQKAIKGGLDYVNLAANPKTIIWWSAQSDVLCVAIGDKITNDTCAPLARAGADFIDVSDYIFTYEKGVMQATVNILHNLETAAQMPNLVS